VLAFALLAVSPIAVSPYRHARPISVVGIVGDVGAVGVSLPRRSRAFSAFPAFPTRRLAASPFSSHLRCWHCRRCRRCRRFASPAFPAFPLGDVGIHPALHSATFMSFYLPCIPTTSRRYADTPLRFPSAPVAQLDRVCDFGSQGCRFEPCRVHASHPSDQATPIFAQECDRHSMISRARAAEGA
jgi:hypothetical protein